MINKSRLILRVNDTKVIGKTKEVESELDLINLTIVLSLDEILVENRFLTSVVFYLQYRFLIDVETIDVNFINVNIDFQKIDVNIHYPTSVITKTDVI